MTGRTNAAGGVRLPELVNPAGAAQILSGYEAINADGEAMVGTIPSQGAQTITPGTSAKTIAAGRYLSGAQTIAGDADLVPANIKSGVNIFGVSGSYSGKEPVYGEWDEGMVSPSTGTYDFVITMPSNIDELMGLTFGDGGYYSSIIGYYIIGMGAGMAMSMQYPQIANVEIFTSGNKINITLDGNYSDPEEFMSAGGRYCYIPA